MAPSNDVPDSTDWLSTPLSGLAAVEAALRCQVCKDLFKTPMITSCSHTFCSICIRRALANDGRCPLCRSAEQELKLRSNWSIEETVEAFSKARETALQLARNAVPATKLAKRAVEDGDLIRADVAPETKRLRTSARLKGRGKEVVAVPTTPFLMVDGDGYGDNGDGDGDNDYTEEEQEQERVVQASDDDEYVLDTKDGLVPCPMCQKKMKEWQVFNHLESCPGPTASRAPPEPSPGRKTADLLSQAQRRQQTKLERLPPLNYSMLKDTALRKKLAELGISNQGPRVILEKRHKEWLTLWNANCDAAVPKSRSQLLQDLDVWERTLGSRAPTTGKAVQNAMLIKDKEFDGNAWAAKHSTSFNDLIANAKKSTLEAKHKKSGMEEDSGNSSTLAAPAAAAAATTATTSISSTPTPTPTLTTPTLPLRDERNVCDVKDPPPSHSLSQEINPRSQDLTS